MTRTARCAHASPQAAAVPALALAPDDVARNRIYAVGAAQGLALDALEVPWREDAERAGADFSFAARLEAALAPLPPAEERLAFAAGWADRPALAAATGRLLARDQRDLEAAHAAFEAEPGLTVSVVVPASGLSRSRSSRGRRWTSDGGRAVLGPRYVAHGLRAPDPEALGLQVSDRGVLDALDETGRRRTVTVHLHGPLELVLDGVERTLDEPVQATGTELRLAAPGLELRADRPVRLDSDGTRLAIDLTGGS